MAVQKDSPQNSGVDGQINAPPKPRIADRVSLVIAGVSVLIAVISLVVSLWKDRTDQLHTSTRDFQKGLIFSILLSDNRPMTIDQIEDKYKSGALSVRNKYHLQDQNFS